MAETMGQYRAWVLEHFRGSGWKQWVRPETKKSSAALSRLLKDGLLEKSAYKMYRITDAGRAALTQGGG